MRVVARHPEIQKYRSAQLSAFFKRTDTLSIFLAQRVGDCLNKDGQEFEIELEDLLGTSLDKFISELLGPDKDRVQEVLFMKSDALFSKYVQREIVPLLKERISDRSEDILSKVTGKNSNEAIATRSIDGQHVPVGEGKLSGASETSKSSSSAKTKVSMAEAKRKCWRLFSEDQLPIVDICRKYLDTHEIKGKPNYTPEKLANMLYSENSQGRTKRYLLEDNKTE